MTNRVRLTPAAATRFPDLAGRTGTVHEVVAGHWHRILWDDGGYVWVLEADLLFEDGGPRSGPECRAREADGSQPLDPSDPNAPAP